MRKNVHLFALLLSVLLLNSCAMILSPKKQKIVVTTNNSKATLYVEDENAGSGETIEAKVTKDLDSKQLKVEAPGYKPAYYAVIQHKLNPLVCVSCLFLAYPYFFDQNSPKAFSYSHTFDCPLVNKKVVRKADSKYISIDEVSFDIKNKDFKFIPINYKNYLNKIDKEEQKPEAKKKKAVNTESEDVKVDNTIFANEIEKVLKETGYIDTVNMIFKDNQNSLTLKANVKSLTFYSVYYQLGYVVPNFYIAKSDITWDVMNSYGEILKSITVRSQSGEFVMHTKKKDSDFRDMLGDLIENSLDQVLTNPSIVAVSKIETNSAETQLAASSITKPTSFLKTASDAQNSTVIVKTKDGHGSGFAISNDGYIITNYHVIAGTDPKKQNELTVILGDGKKVKATVEKFSKSKDLALIKVNETFEKCFEIPTKKNFSVLEEVFVMGAPKSIELGQSAAKGIISSERNVNNLNLIQTNIGVSPGNSGGPMFNKDGTLYGVVVSKIIGGGAEGIAFCIPAYKISEFLNISFK